MPALLWDVYCRVIDNLGDAGVCWRLATGLAARGQRVRLVIDDAAALAFMAPGGLPGVDVMDWPGPAQPGEVVIEAFGCALPPATEEQMAGPGPAPVWLNLEYLSAEPYVERSHGLPSPQPNGLTKWFFFPGFTPRTGGLLRECGLAERRAAFDRQAWLQAQGIAVRPGERVVTLFCYDNPALPALLQALAAEPTLLLLTPGPAQRQVQAAPAGLRLQRLPWLTQTDFDHLLWSADLNFVRGEDSLLRALWAGSPFVWQAYPQRDGAHAAKVEALLASFAAVASVPPPVATLWRAWNGLTPARPPPPSTLPITLPAPWVTEAQAWRAALLEQPDLVTRLLDFVASCAGRGRADGC